MEHLPNPHRHQGLSHPDLVDLPWPEADAGPTQRLLARCPRAAETPLVSAPDLAVRAGVGALDIKDERTRMGLGRSLIHHRRCQRAIKGVYWW